MVYMNEAVNCEEDEAYWDFIGWYLGQEWVPLQWVPVQEKEDRFVGIQIEEVGHGRYVDVSHFNTWDFARESGYKFDVGRWKHKKVLERIRDLALTHSVSREAEAKERLRRVVQGIIEANYVPDKMREARGCVKVWRRYAYWE